MSAVHVLATVESNDFVTDDVVAWCEFGGQLSGDLEVVGDELVGNPGSWADDGVLRDLGPAERTGGQGRAVTCACD